MISRPRGRIWLISCAACATLLLTGFATVAASAAPNSAALGLPVTHHAATPVLRHAASAPAQPFDAAVHNPTNPLAGRPWGVYKGSQEQAWQPYRSASGHRKKLLAKIALRPKAKWYGAWLSPRQIRSSVRKYVRNSVRGHPHALVQLTIFRVQPWEQEATRRLPTKAEIASYHKWIDNCATALRRAHVALVLQPDGPFANQAPHHSLVLSHLVRYAAKRFSQQPNTSVYIEAGSADWTRGNIRPAVKLLSNGGIGYARGFALNATHYDATTSEIHFGTRIAQSLARRGYHNKHFVINTADNGRPFTGKWWRAHPTGTGFNNAGVCQTKTQTHCVTLGIPPTWRVTASRWGLPATARAQAAKYVDAYLWFGRPWLKGQSNPFEMSRALPMCRTTPYRFNGQPVG
jgi:endoglucanase